MDGVTEFALPEISEATILRAENARLKMLLAHVIGSIDDICDAEGWVRMEGQLIEEARRYAAGDSGLQQILTQMVIDAIQTDRNTRREPQG